MNIQQEAIKLKGKWITTTFKEAKEGSVKSLIDEIVIDAVKGFVFYGIAVHDHKDTFRYFVGYPSIDGTVILPQGNYYAVKKPKDAEQAYLKIKKMNLPIKPLFEGNPNYDALPVKIEVYRDTGLNSELIEILIPLQ